ncbi:MAG: hypothetical protein ABSH19_09840, partial [Opitutales bacterium]
FEIILEWLNRNDEIAFIIADGPGRWRATLNIPRVDAPRTCLWHVPSGPLPLLRPHPSRLTDPIFNPWKGWVELRTSTNQTTPYFGAGHPGVVWLNRRLQARLFGEGVGLSSFEWIGNRYSVIGSPAKEVTEKFWQSLRRWVKKSSKKIPRSGSVDGPHPEIYAFPSAHASFVRGQGRDPNP